LVKSIACKAIRSLACGRYREKTSCEQPSDMTAIDPLRLKGAMRNLASGVTIVTALDAGDQPVGATVSSFASLSLDPPLVLVCLTNMSRTVQAIRHRGSFAVHLLETSQAELAQRFAQDQGEKFADGGHEVGPFAVPLLKECRTHLVCSLYAEQDGGDHRIFLGQVEEAHYPEDFRPLVHYNRAFWDLSQLQ
jgi:3-hydroxy-9,10-secoandrosta-1,3,5(10)-triene-9,17-dione monooxygenase reductase component